MRKLVDEGYVRCVMVSNPKAGGDKANYYFVKDYEVDEKLAQRIAARRARDARVKTETVAGKVVEVEIPEIFKMYQPAIPPRETHRRVTSNDKPDRPPLTRQDGQGSGRRSSWHNSNTPLHKLAL